MDIVRVGIDTPRMEYRQGTPVLTAKRRSILAAMLYAVEHTEPGTLILQEDVEIEPAYLPVAAGRIRPGTITCLNPPRTPLHTCPRAFIISDEETRQQLITAWSRRPEMQACLSWQEIPKNYPEIRGSHAGYAWR